MRTELEKKLIAALREISSFGGVDVRSEGEEYPDVMSWYGNYDDCFEAGREWGSFEQGEIARASLEGVDT